jgi:ectoine hydroxylase-related dioxygenase (phytanoyl-CoA dioxygenase family)
VVLDGSLPLFAEYFACHDAPDGGWPQADWFRLSEETLQWFYDRGCKWVKVEAQPGDLILWDSRTIHYGDAARGDRPRMAAYVCYKPAKDISSEMLALKRDCFAEYSGTTHDPLNFRVANANTRKWVIGPNDRVRPRTEASLSERAKQLAGLVSY